MLPIEPILFFDGTCGLCHATVRWILKHDRRGTIRFAPLQGETYAALAVPNKPRDLTTVVFLDDGSLFIRGAAVVRFLKRMGGTWSPIGAVGAILPRALSDACYRFVANRRVRWFGTVDACALPSPSERLRFLPKSAPCFRRASARLLPTQFAGVSPMYGADMCREPLCMALRTILHASSVAAIAVLPSIALGQVVAYDGFANGPLVDLNGSTGGTGWSAAWMDVQFDQPTDVATTGLTYPGLNTVPGAAVTGTGASGYPLSRYERLISLPPQGLTKMYVSFLLRPDASFGSWGGLSFGTYPDVMYVGLPIGTYAYYGLSSSNGLVSFSDVPLVQGETTFVVVEIATSASAAGITYKLYVNPIVGDPEPMNPDAALSVANVNSLPTGLSIDNQGGFTTDEIRVNTTWQGAAPALQAGVADLDSSGSVDAADLAMLLGQWGLRGGDLDGDGITNSTDLAILLGAWGS